MTCSPHQSILPITALKWNFSEQCEVHVRAGQINFFCVTLSK